MHLDIDIKGVTCDYRKVEPGYVFVDAEEDALSGNLHIKYALERGATAIYTGRNLETLPENVPVIKVQNPKKALAKLLSKFYGYPSEKINVIGVTGSNGKTVTSHMIEKIIKTAGYNTGLIDTVSIVLGGEKYPGRSNSYDSETLQELLARMVAKKIYATVLEVSLHQLVNYSVDSIDFNVAVHTVVSQEERKNINVMRYLFNMLPSGGTAIINTDDPYGLALVKQNPMPLIITYGLGSKATITASSIDVSNTGVTYTCCLQRSFTNMLGNDVEPQEIPIRLRVPGRHNVYNSLAAVAVGLLFGVKGEVIQKALEDFKGVWRRMQIIYDNEFTVIDSFTHNPASYDAVFETVQSMDFNNLIIVAAVRGRGGTEINRENGAAVRHWASLLGAKEVIVTSSQDATESNYSVSNEEKEAFLQGIKGGQVDIKYFDSLEEALNRMLSGVGRGDMVVLMGAEGMNRAQDILMEKLNPESKDRKKDPNHF